jgi:uncharacterized protein
MSIFAVEYVYGPEGAQARDEHRPLHRAWLMSLAEAGTVLASGPFADGAGALLIFQAEDEAALQQLLTQDPFNAVGGISGLKISGWSPVIGMMSHLAT